MHRTMKVRSRCVLQEDCQDMGTRYDNREGLKVWLVEELADDTMGETHAVKLQQFILVCSIHST